MEKTARIQSFMMCKESERSDQEVCISQFHNTVHDAVSGIDWEYEIKGGHRSKGHSIREQAEVKYGNVRSAIRTKYNKKYTPGTSTLE